MTTRTIIDILILLFIIIWFAGIGLAAASMILSIISHHSLVAWFCGGSVVSQIIFAACIYNSFK